MDYRARVEAIRASMAERAVDVLLVGQPANRRYLSGFAGSDDSAAASSGWIVLTPTSGYFLTTFNYLSAVREQIRHLEPVQAKPRMLPALVELLSKVQGNAIGFEAGWVTYDVYQALTRELASGRELKPVVDAVEDARVSKDADEIAVLRRAITITDQAYTEVTRRIRHGQTEREVAWALERRLRELGAEAMAFGPTVAAGPHAAVPHHESTDVPIRAGEPVWIDMGARVDGYCGDLTRSFCLGEASTDYLEAYALVERSHDAAIAGARAGRTGIEVDAVAREVIAGAGRGDEFGHGLGHGIGLEIHERPRLGSNGEEKLRRGMVTTIEPGVYRPGWGGIRIEDVVLIGEDGAEVLSHAPASPVLG